MKQRIRIKLAGFFTIDSDFEKWYKTKNMYLDDKTPQQLVDSGSGQRVLNFLHQMGAK